MAACVDDISEQTRDVLELSVLELSVLVISLFSEYMSKRVSMQVRLTLVRVGGGQDGAVLLLDLLHIL